MDQDRFSLQLEELEERIAPTVTTGESGVTFGESGDDSIDVDKTGDGSDAFPISQGL